MASIQTVVDPSRRSFLKKALILGSMGVLESRELLSMGPSRTQGTGVDSIPSAFQYRTMSVAHFPALQERIDRLKREDKLSRNPVYRSYIDQLGFHVPKGFPEAKSIIVVAAFSPAGLINFHLKGRVHQVLLSPQYFSTGATRESILSEVRSKIVQDPKARIEFANDVHLKLLVVHSGLGRYGRNNLCYVDGFGSFIVLRAFLTDRSFPEDSWRDVGLMEACRDCQICYGICPTNAITRQNFVIDVGRCITLYNEVNGPFPNFIHPSMHNALMGCMKCQLGCPANEGFLKRSLRFEDVTEEETGRILSGHEDAALLTVLQRKLRRFPPSATKEDFPIFTRNLGVLLHV